MTGSHNAIMIFSKKMNTPLKVIAVFLFSLLLFSFFNRHLNSMAISSDVILRNDPTPVRETLFPVQCIDTMKLSRDKAREFERAGKRDVVIKNQIDTIASLGANCVAIGTPYNDEFFPVLTAWVKEARSRHLRVWFRGNFAEWEGWFNYPKNMSTQAHIKKTEQFILAHPDLFEDGDIFTPAPEAENGGPFNPVNSAAKTVRFRRFLIDEQKTSENAFKQINKSVTTNWLSMSGGVAKHVLDEKTTQELGYVVTIDHYVASVADMKSYVDFFADTNRSEVVLGEFGAPIPDINGLMTETEQAEFVEDLLESLYGEKKKVIGVNYWTLTDSSTALLNSLGKEKKVAATLKKYYLPGVLAGTIRNSIGEPVNGAILRTDDGVQTAKTDAHGRFSLTVPAGKRGFAIGETEEFVGKKFRAEFSPGQKIQADITLKPQKVLLFYRFKALLYRLTN